MKPFRNILVAVDFAESSHKALALAEDLAALTGGMLTVVHVCKQPSYVYSGIMLGMADLTAPIKEAARKHLDQTMADVRRRVPDAKGMLRMGVAWSEIVAAIDTVHADLVVLGTHGRRGFRHALLGSVAEKVVRLSPVPVLTVRHAAPAPADTDT